MTESPQSLRALFDSAKAQQDAIFNPADESTSLGRVSDVVEAFEDCHRLIGQLSLFSSNEEIDDIASADLHTLDPSRLQTTANVYYGYLSVDYLLAELLLRTYDPDREKTLRRVQDAFESFLERLDDYGILPPGDKKLYKQYLEHPSSFSLASTSDATERRRVKVARFQEEKALKEKLKYLRANESLLQMDDSSLRELYLTELKFQAHQTFQSLDIISQELTMLAHARSAPPQPTRPVADDRQRNGLDKNGYSDRLDPSMSQLLKGGKGPLLSKDGKPLQPFTLTDKRTQLRDGVFRPDHSLPTMSIDEYLEEEKRRGGMIEGGGEASGQQQQVDEDNMELADAETMKAREWDEFTEQNPKGAGNTINRG